MAGDGAEACLVLGQRGPAAVRELAPLLPGLCEKLYGWRVYVPPGTDGGWPAVYEADDGSLLTGRVAGQTYCAGGMSLGLPGALPHEMVHAYQCPAQIGHAAWADAGYCDAIDRANAQGGTP
jgi:hypothetical protein